MVLAGKVARVVLGLLVLVAVWVVKVAMVVLVALTGVVQPFRVVLLVGTRVVAEMVDWVVLVLVAVLVVMAVLVVLVLVQKQPLPKTLLLLSHRQFKMYQRVTTSITLLQATQRLW